MILNYKISCLKNYFLMISTIKQLLFSKTGYDQVVENFYLYFQSVRYLKRA